MELEISFFFLFMNVVLDILRDWREKIILENDVQVPFPTTTVEMEKS